jgi:hypothetical protein
LIITTIPQVRRAAKITIKIMNRVIISTAAYEHNTINIADNHRIRLTLLAFL